MPANDVKPKRGVRRQRPAHRKGHQCGAFDDVIVFPPGSYNSGKGFGRVQALIARAVQAGGAIVEDMEGIGGGREEVTRSLGERDVLGVHIGRIHGRRKQGRRRRRGYSCATGAPQKSRNPRVKSPLTIPSTVNY